MSVNPATGEVSDMNFRFKNRNFSKHSSEELPSKETLTYEVEDKETDPNMFVMKTREVGRKGMGLVGTKRMATSTK